MPDTRFRLDHVMLPVRDASRSARFYESILSMQVVEERRDDNRHIMHVGYGPRGSHPTLELIEDRRVSEIACGGGHICMSVPDLASLSAQIETAGVPQVRPAAWRDERLVRIWIADPDGHLLEISERTR